MTSEPFRDDDGPDGVDDHDLGLTHDLDVMARLDGLQARLAGAMTRRRALRVLGIGAGAAGLTLATGPSALATVTGGGCVRVPEETAGPFPGDGSNGPNVLATSGVVRRDIRSSFGSLSGTAHGVPLTIRVRVQDVSNGCADLAGAAVYVWHSTREGGYSLYSSGLTNQNFLRGVQRTDSTGRVTFKSIFPGAYPGRWPHIHFEVYPSLATATSAANKLVTSQIALPRAACQRVYARPAYAASRSNLANSSMATDNVFNDGASRQLANMSGSNAAGWTASLTVGVP